MANRIGWWGIEKANIFSINSKLHNCFLANRIRSDFSSPSQGSFLINFRTKAPVATSKSRMTDQKQHHQQQSENQTKLGFCKKMNAEFHLNFNYV